jgi:hypothetical protein
LSDTGKLYSLELTHLINGHSQMGVQFVQIGNDPRATKALKELDDDLHKTGNIRVCVAFVPYDLN